MDGAVTAPSGIAPISSAAPDEAARGDAVIAVSRVSKTYATASADEVAALGEVSFTIARGEFVSVVGPSGCGKTTLLRILAGLIGRYEGDVRLRGGVLRGPTRDVGVAFQDANLLPWRTVVQNMMLPVEVLGLDRRAGLARAHQLIDLVGLHGFANSLPQELSGGMRQRVSIARALIHDPSILLLDEPFGALDAITRDAMNLELMRIWAGSGKTVFLITHSIPEAVLLSDRVLVMSERPGHIVADIPIGIARPRSLEVIATPTFGEYLLHVRRLLDGGQIEARAARLRLSAGTAS
jgi:NitT/TauT family transport system ATP-binding protein